MIGLLMLAAALQGVTRTEEPVNFQVPPPIMPHFLRYIQCVELEVRSEVDLPSTQPILQQAYEEALTDCADTRRVQVAEADRLLRRERKYRDEEVRRQTIDETFQLADQVRNLYRDAAAE